VVVTDPTQKTVSLNVIAKIHKYRTFHEGHHTIPMTMEVHDTPRRDMDCFIKECARLFHIDDQEVIYPCLLHSIFQVAC
jgi:hypothetical protein